MYFEIYTIYPSHFSWLILAMVVYIAMLQTDQSDLPTFLAPVLDKSD